MDSIVDLPGLGPRSQEMLASAGITRAAQLRKLGSVAAFAMVRKAEPHASLNLLWALESALSGEPWQAVARKHRTSLLLALEEFETGTAPVPRP
jgi:DNA transformation protein